jgi:squalene-hopene/tetraprenyl-beta-curcumene cyclase
MGYTTGRKDPFLSLTILKNQALFRTESMNAATQGESQNNHWSPEEIVGASVHSAVAKAQDCLLRLQHPDGHWCGELEGDTILESEYILTMYFIGRSGEGKARKAANYLVEKSLPEGGWAIYPGGPPDVSASAKAYFALMLLGHDPNASYVLKARQVVCDLGGLAATNSFTRLYLAIFGQVPWERCPAVPPELILLPAWCPLNLYEMSSWSRCIIVPLSVIWACRPSCPVPETASLQELWVGSPRPRPRQGFWQSFFTGTDTILKFLESHRFLPWRKRALKACEEWMIQHFQNSDGIGAIFPPIVNSIIALRCLGYANDHPLTRSQIRELENLEIEESTSLRVAPCFSPVWDTALTMVSLVDSGLKADHPALCRAGGWLLEKEVKTVGDWKIKNPKGEPGGWYFEHANEFYPDVDDTFQVLTALSKVRFPNESDQRRKAQAMERALCWVLSMQNEDGGWASFDCGCNRQFLTKIPFADHNAMIDPSTSDITGRGLETLAALDFFPEHSAVRRAWAFLLQEQERDGTWFGRWGCNYIYGSWLVLRGLQCSGGDMGKDHLQATARWLQSVQNSDGGWGELPRSYEDPSSKGKGPSTPSQTAWAILGLIASGNSRCQSVLKGVAYLVLNQREDGSWRDEFWTATGFPKVFYLSYHLYATYFPLLALGHFIQSNRQESPTHPCYVSL